MIVIVDYGMGNLGSIANMFKRLGIPAELSREPAKIAQAERLILPGVGAFDKGMQNLRALGLVEPLTARVVNDRVPILGICLGMQLMTSGSEEGQEPGLGWVPARTVHLASGEPPAARAMRFPHIGWNFVELPRPHPLVQDLPPDPRFYFVHTYKVECERAPDVLVQSSYGEIHFTAGFAVGSIAGVQFHPEKSHRFGMKLLSSFAGWSGS